MAFHFCSRYKRMRKCGECIVRGLQEGAGELKKVHFRIAFIGWDADQSRKWLTELAFQNGGRFLFPGRDVVLLPDGTLIEAVIRMKDGSRYDQMIVADDRRKLIFEKKDCISKMEFVRLHRSGQIPEEFFQQFYDLDAERE